MVARGNPSLKIQWEVHFFYFFIIRRNVHFFFRTVICIALYEKTAFKTDFGPQEVPKLENLHFHAFSGW